MTISERGVLYCGSGVVGNKIQKNWKLDMWENLGGGVMENYKRLKCVGKKKIKKPQKAWNAIIK